MFDDSQFNLKKFLASANHWIVIVNVLVFLMTDLILNPPVAARIVDAGALGYDAFLAGDYYRIITCMFLHGNISHIMGNMMMIILIGDMLEGFFGHVRYVILYFLTGILAGVASMGYNMMMSSHSSSIGASGAGFGLLGAVIVLLLADRGLAQRLTLARIGLYILFSVIAGITSTGTDVAAHLGGLAAGLLVCPVLILSKRKGGSRI